jgi:hypothetical protein
VTTAERQVEPNSLENDTDRIEPAMRFIETLPRK